MRIWVKLKPKLSIKCVEDPFKDLTEIEIRKRAEKKSVREGLTLINFFSLKIQMTLQLLVFNLVYFEFRTNPLLFFVVIVFQIPEKT